MKYTESYSRQPYSVHPKVTDILDDHHFIKMQVLRKHTSTASNFENIFASVRDLTISESSVKRRLKDSNFLSRKPVNGPLLTAEHLRQRLRD